MTAGSPPVAIRGPLSRADLPGLYARVCGIPEANAGGLLVCDVSGLAADAVAVEALCRLRLGALHRGRAVRLRGASRELLEIVALVGLADVLGPELGVEV